MLQITKEFLQKTQEAVIEYDKGIHNADNLIVHTSLIGSGYNENDKSIYAVYDVRNTMYDPDGVFICRQYEDDEENQGMVYIDYCKSVTEKGVKL